MRLKTERNEMKYRPKLVFATEQMQKEEIRGDMPDLNIKPVKIAFHFYFYFKTHLRKEKKM